MNRRQGKSFSISSDDQRCVWMQAGVLNYHLCDRDFDCARCPLHAAFRHESMASVTGLAPGGTRLYSRRHCWMQLRNDRVVVGIEPKLASRLIGVSRVVLPEVGATVESNHIAAVIVAEGQHVPLFAPSGGIVSAVNEIAIINVDQLTEDPLGEGWLFSYHAKSVSQSEDLLMAPDAADKRFEDDEAGFRRDLQGLIASSGDQAGATLNDGGVATKRVFHAITPAQYYYLLRLHFCKEAKMGI